MPPVGLHIEVELSVSQYVCQSVRPSGKKTSTLAITFALLKIETWYLACVCTSWSWTFLIGERSSFKVKCQIYGVCPSENFNIGHNFFNIEDSNLIFGVHVYLMKLHILSGGGSRSSFKVKGKKKQQSGAIWGIVFLTNTSLFNNCLWWEDNTMSN